MLRIVDLAESLTREGWDVTEWTDAPSATYPMHKHRRHEVIVVLEGMLTMVKHGVRHELRPGDRYDVVPDEEHEAIVGPDGCTYLAGAKR